MQLVAAWATQGGSTAISSAAAHRQQGDRRQGDVAPVETLHAVLGDAVAPEEGQNSLLRPGSAG